MSDSGLGQLARLTEINVDEVGVNGAKNFFEAKIEQQLMTNKFHDEIRYVVSFEAKLVNGIFKTFLSFFVLRQEQEEKRRMEEERILRRQQFQQRAAVFQ